MPNFKKFTTVGEGMERLQEKLDFEKNSIPLSIDFLADTMRVISPNDLILIGGRSGGGKTELAIHMALQAAMKNKKVYFFALEAEADEVSFRLLYRVYAQKYFSERRYSKELVSYDRWLNSEAPKMMYENYHEIAAGFAAANNLKIRYATSDYGLEDFQRDMDEIKNDANLVILDHLHYFEIDEAANENSEYKKIVKAIRSECLDKNIPVILVSHIRKANPLYVQFCPEQEDFHGTSDIVKIATKAITIGSGANKEIWDAKGCIMATSKYFSFLKVVKNRRNGTVTHHMAAVIFDQDTNDYDAGYMIGRPVYDKESKKMVFQLLPDADLPRWAINATRSGP